MTTEKIVAEPEVDLETLFRLLDTALTSNDPNIKAALKNLLVITALFAAHTPQKAIVGPISEILTRLSSIERRISDLETSPTDESKYEKYKKLYYDEHLQKKWSITDKELVSDGYLKSMLDAFTDTYKKK